jgi:hypothetical protein
MAEKKLTRRQVSDLTAITPREIPGFFESKAMRRKIQQMFGEHPVINPDEFRARWWSVFDFSRRR